MVVPFTLVVLDSDAGISDAARLRKAGAPAVAKRACVVVVLAGIVLGVAPAPPPITTAFAVSRADDARVPEAVKPRMPPEVPDVRFVPPCDTVTAALLVRTLALALGKVNVLVEPAGPATAKKPLFRPPFAVGKTPVTLVVRSIVAAAISAFTTDPKVRPPCRT